MTIPRDEPYLHPLDREYLELLEDFRQRHPEAHVLYVEGGRRGRRSRNKALRRAIAQQDDEQ